MELITFCALTGALHIYLNLISPAGTWRDSWNTETKVCVFIKDIMPFLSVFLSLIQSFFLSACIMHCKQVICLHNLIDALFHFECNGSSSLMKRRITRERVEEDMCIAMSESV